MAEHTIAAEDAGKHPAVCAAYIVEGITNADAKSSATEAVVEYFLSKGDVDSAAAFADSLDDPFARDRLLIGVIGKCIDLKDDEYAFQLADAVEDTGLRAGAIEVAALRLASRGEFERALEIASKLEHASDTIAGIAVTQAAQGLKEAANATLDGIDYAKASVNARIEIAAEHIREKRPEQALQWLSAAAAQVSEIDFEEDRIRALTEIAGSFFDAGDQTSAGDYFLKAAARAVNLDNNHRDGFLVAAAIGLLKAGSIDVADETLDQVEDKTQVAACLYGFSRVYEQSEKTDAIETIEEALAMLNSQSEYEIRSTQSRNEMFAAVAIQFQRVGLTQRAVEIAHANGDEMQRNQALTSIAQLLVMDGKEAEADEIVTGIEPESDRLSASIALSDAANTVENKELAVTYLRNAAELVGEVEQHIARAEVSDQIALRLDAYGKTEEAIAIARKNLLLISEIRDDGGQAMALVRLESVYTKLGIEPDDNDKSLLTTLVRKVDW